MTPYDFRLAARHLWRRKVYSLVIVLSLAIGFACSCLLLSFIVSELRTDSFHTRGIRTFQLFSDDPFEGKGKISYIIGTTVDYLQDNYPEVERIVQLGTIEVINLASSRSTIENVELLAVDSTFFSIFDYPLYAGSASRAFTPETIVLSREKALALFGNERPIGEILTMKTPDTTRTLVVSAVLDHSPEQSHLKFEALIAQQVLKKRMNGGATYVQLRTGTSADVLETKLNQDVKVPGLMGEGKLHYNMEPLADSYFNEFNRTTFMRTRSLPFLKTAGLVCGLILFMAAFNFVSLYLLSLQERKKETGIRKTLGVNLWSRVKSLTTEVILYVAIAWLLAIGLIVGVLPYLNNILETSLSVNYVFRLDLVAMAAGIVLVLVLIVITFSVVQQNRVVPISLMRNSATSRLTFNRSLFTVQFVISITLAVCAVTIIRQMHYLETAPLGFNRQMVVIRVNQGQAPRLTALKTELLRLPGIKHAAISTGSPVFGNWMVRYELKDGKTYTPMLFSGDEDMIKTLDLQLLKGEVPTATRQGRLVNETLVKMFDMKDPIGQTIPGAEEVIIGVVKDFTVTSFKDQIQPAIISYSTGNSRLLIDYRGEELASVLPAIENAWKKVYPGEYFSYHPIQDELMKKYKDDTFLFKTVVSYAIVSMVISCFGLFAMSWAVAQSRMKEVGIRKVLGAKAANIVRLLSLSFVKRIIIAFILAAPLSYYLMSVWLERFARKVPMDILTFVCAGVAVAFVALLTMSVQTLRAALSNPVEELRRE